MFSCHLIYLVYRTETCKPKLLRRLLCPFRYIKISYEIRGTHTYQIFTAEPMLVVARSLMKKLIYDVSGKLGVERKRSIKLSCSLNANEIVTMMQSHVH